MLVRRIGMLAVGAIGLAVLAFLDVGRGGGAQHGGHPSDALAKTSTPAAAARRSRRAPVVMLLLDEFPVDQIRKPDGSIDEVRFPNFARLAGMSTWFPNAAAAFDETTWATPAIWDGMKARRGTRPLLRDHPHNLFTWLGAKGYGIVYRDPATALCPTRYCHRPIRESSKLYALLHKRRERLQAWIRSIRPHRRPYLYATHEDLPHKPWVYLPSGRNDQPTASEPVAGINSVKSFYNSYLTDHNHRRQLLQIGFVDREIGVLLRHLRRVGLLDKSVIVVTADHGYAWELGVRDRRRVTQRNIDEVATVPLFIKGPGQRRGAVNRNYARVIDIVPTISDLMNLKLNYRPDGRSAFGPAARRRRTVQMWTRDWSRLIKVGAAEMEARRTQNIRATVDKFRTGTESQLLYGNPWQTVYRYGPFPEVIGRPVSQLRVTRAVGLGARIADSAITRVRRRGSLLVHTHIAGRIDGGRPREDRVVAVAVNGIVRAVGRSFHLLGESQETFSLLVPEESMRVGRNDVRVFEVSNQAGSFVLTPLGSNS